MAKLMLRKPSGAHQGEMRPRRRPPRPRVPHSLHHRHWHNVVSTARRRWQPSLWRYIMQSGSLYSLSDLSSFYGNTQASRLLCRIACAPYPVPNCPEEDSQGWSKHIIKQESTDPQLSILPLSWRSLKIDDHASLWRPTGGEWPSSPPRPLAFAH